MNYAIKTGQGYVSRNQMPPQSNRVIAYTPERASARWYFTEAAAATAARRYGIKAPFEIQHVEA